MKPPFSLILLARRNPTPNPPNLRRSSSLAASPSPSPQSPSPRVAAIVDEISNLTLLETSDLTRLLFQKLSIDQMPTLAVISGGMSFSGVVGTGSTAAAAVDGEKKEEKEKTAFDIKLEGFDAAAKIKVIKEVRSFTNLGLKEAKELVEKAPVVVKGGVAKEEAEKILEKLKEIGAKVILE